MPRYPASSFGPSRYEIEARECTDPARLDELAGRRSNFVQSAVAANAHTRPDTLTALSASENKWTRMAVAKNEATPLAVLLALAADPESSVRMKVAYNPNLDHATLTTLAHDAASDVRTAVARHTASDPHLLASLASDPDERVRVNVARNPNTPDATLVALAHDSSFDVRRALGSRGFNPHGQTETVTVRRFNGRRTETYQQERHVEQGGRYPADLIRAFAHSPDVKAHFRAASQPDAPEDALLHLATSTDTVEYTLKIIAENRGASARVLDAVARRAETQSCKAVAVHPTTSEDTLVMLALSPARSVGAAIANGRSGGLEWLASHHDPRIRAVAAKNLDTYTGPLSREQVITLASALLTDEADTVQVAAARSVSVSVLASMTDHPNPHVRKVLAQRSTAPQVLTVLAADTSPVVRRAVAQNKSTPVDALGVLAGDQDARVRVNAAERFMSALTG